MPQANSVSLLSPKIQALSCNRHICSTCQALSHPNINGAYHELSCGICTTVGNCMHTTLPSGCTAVLHAFHPSYACVFHIQAPTAGPVPQR